MNRSEKIMINPQPPAPGQGPNLDQATNRQSSFRRYAVPAALVVGGVTVGSFLAPIGFASAQEDGDDQVDQADQGAETDDDDRGRGDGRRGGPHAHIARGARLEVLTDSLGLDADELRAALAEGKSLADVAAEQGVAVEDLSAALVAEAEERIDDAVAEGMLDAERAEDMKAGLAERIDDHINRVPGERAGGEFGPGKGKRGPGGVFGDRAEMGTELAEFLGLSTDELRAAFTNGRSLADVADEQDVSEEALVDFLLERLEERLDQAVEDEKIDAGRAEQMLEDAEERIQDHIDDVPGDHQHHGRRGHGRHGGLKGFGSDGADDDTTDTGVTNDTSFQA
jgi:hypothetical protein